MDFYLNDLYPNMGFNNTRTETIPEPADKQALGEDGKTSYMGKTSTKQKNNIFIAIAIFVIIAVVLGVLK